MSDVGVVARGIVPQLLEWWTFKSNYVDSIMKAFKKTEQIL